MTSLFQAESIITIITLLIAYFFSLLLAESFQAKTALAFGDDTAEREGFLSFNPLYYIDWVGVMVIFAFRVGWGKVVPINPHNILGKARLPKIIFTYFSESLAYISIAIVAFFTNLLLIGPHATEFTYRIMFVERNVSLRALGALFPGKSSLLLALVMVLASTIFLNIFMAMLSFVINGFRLLFYIGAERGYNFMKYADVISFVGPLIVLVFFRGYITITLIHVITRCAYFVAALFGMSL